MPSRQCLLLACFLEVFLACAAAQVEVAITTNKAAYVAGEPVFIAATITNTTASPLTIVVPTPDSCVSAISVVVEGLRRSDLPACMLGPKTTACSYNGPPATPVEIKPQTSYDMRRLVNLTYELDRPRDYQAHVKFSMLYTDQPVLERPSSFEHPTYRHANYEKDVTLTVVEGDEDALKAAFAPVVADLDSGDFARQWHAQLVLLNLAPPFAEDRILAWADRTDLGQEAMAALRKLGTKRAIQKLEATAFEKPGRNDQREGVRQAALTEIRYINDQSLLPRLFEITTEDRGQSIRWAAARRRRQNRTRGCGWGHCADALKCRPLHRICRSGGTRRHKQSRCRSGIDLRDSLGAGGQQTTRNHRGTDEAHTPNDTRRSCRTGCHLSDVDCLVVGSPRRCGHLCPGRLWHHRETTLK